MKNYFKFNLTGRKLLPIWMFFLIAFFVPYLTLIIKMQNVQPGTNFSLLFFPIFILLMIIVSVLTFYLVKLTIENISFKDKTIVFNGSFGNYIGTVLLGMFLSFITLGVYMAWIIRNIHRFFIDHSSHDSNAFKFQGKGGDLFVILLLTLIVPIILFTIVMFAFISNNSEQIYVMAAIQQLVIWLIMVPYMYYVYKWMVNVDYKDYNISWKTNFWSSCGKIAIEMFLSIITLGIYWPMAVLRLYKYFTERTIADSNERKLKFGFDMDPLNDFLFIWGQALLVIITLGIYYSWAFCKIGSRILGKTYLTENNAIE
ncbi:MAG: DUF898 family protein [Bacteroidales bacterium]|nr:DUF898 family protein [Bacteroidales bacterium]